MMKSRKGFCMAHGSYLGISCGKCNFVTPEASKLLETAEKTVGAMFDAPNVGTVPLGTLIHLCMSTPHVERYLAHYADSILERNLAKARIKAIISKYLTVYVVKEFPPEPFNG